MIAPFLKESGGGQIRIGVGGVRNAGRAGSISLKSAHGRRRSELYGQRLGRPPEGEMRPGTVSGAEKDSATESDRQGRGLATHQ